MGEALELFASFYRDPAAGPGPRAATVEPLTQRELEVLQLVARGTTNRD